MTTQLLVDRSVQVPMRDGTVLVGDVYRPAAAGPVPTLLQRLPYDRTVSFGTIHIGALEPLRAASAGVAVMIQDTRGRFASDGAFTPFVHEASDGADTVAWIRRQPWSDGHVGTYGGSYNGATQMLAASRSPDGLVSIAPNVTTDQYHEDWTYRGGALQLGFLLLWIIESLAPQDVLRMPAGSDRQAAKAILTELQADPEAAFRRLPVADEELLTVAPYLQDWLEHPAADAYWEAIDPSTSFARMDVAGLHVAGWNDIFIDGSLRAYTGLRTRAPSRWARDGQHLVVGPWSHGNPLDWQGDVWHGYSANQGALDLTAMHLEHFTAALERRPADLPRVRLFVQGADRWRDEDEWPLARAVPRTYHLRTGADDTTGSLTREPPPATGEGPRRFRADPRDPVPTVGGASFLPGLLRGHNSGQKDLADLHARPDVLRWVSEPLDEALEVTGVVTATIHVASDAPDLDVVVTLADVAPDGTARGIVTGIQRLRYRNGGPPTWLADGEVAEVEVRVGATSHEFAAGHRLEVLLASSCFPRFDRNPQQAIDVASATSEADLHPASHVVFADASRPSHVVLPVVGRGRA